VLQPGVLPYTCYPSTPQQLINDAFELGVAVQVATLTGVLLQSTTPGIDQTGFVWARLDGSGFPVTPFLWAFASGAWLAKHPIPAGDQRLYFLNGVQADVDILDGGLAGVVGDASGPFWQIDSTMAARFPVGAGTTASGVSLVNGATGGLEEQTLTVAQLAAHQHAVGDPGRAEPFEWLHWDFDGGNTGGTLNQPAWPATPAGAPATNRSTVTTDEQGEGDPINIMPPYRVGIWIRRTARIFCTQPIA